MKIVLCLGLLGVLTAAEPYFEPEAGDYVMRRMTYRGEGGWSWPLAHGKLEDVTRRVVPKIGTDGFFELL